MKLPKIETLVILIFFGAVCLWAISKCRSKQATLAAKDKKYEEDDRPDRSRDTVFVPQTTPQTSAQPTQNQPTTVQTSPQPQPQFQDRQPPANQQPATIPGRTPAAGNPQPTSPTTTQPAAATPKYSTLYVVIDGLKMRKEAGLKGDLVAKLELYEPVSFLNQKTEWTQEISLGKEKVTDHWVKIRTKSGKEGWVFGAGVHYYKMKRKGVLE